MRTLSVFVAITMFVIDFYIAFQLGVNVGMAQTHTVLILPPQESLPIPKAPPAQKKDLKIPMSYTFSSEDEKCLALNIYWEARDQDLEGKLAIGLVTMHRVRSKYYPNTVCEVVWQKNKDKRTGKYVAQFSWTLDGRSDKPKNPQAWQRAQLIASAFADGAYIHDLTNGAYLYHAKYVDPYWSNHYKQVAQIGSHLFYR